MTATLYTEVSPINKESTGAWRVGKSRVLVEIVIRAFDDGATPEAIQQGYPTATLAEIYSVIAYYLGHREEIQAYLNERDRAAIEVRRKLEEIGATNQVGLREHLLARRAKP